MKGAQGGNSEAVMATIQRLGVDEVGLSHHHECLSWDHGAFLGGRRLPGCVVLPMRLAWTCARERRPESQAGALVPRA